MAYPGYSDKASDGLGAVIQPVAVVRLGSHIPSTVQRRTTTRRNASSLAPEKNNAYRNKRIAAVSSLHVAKTKKSDNFPLIALRVFPDKKILY
jgi:hypothetical protein